MPSRAPSVNRPPWCLGLLLAAAIACDERTLEQHAAPATSASHAAASPLVKDDAAAVLRERGDRAEHGTAPVFGAPGASLTLVLFEDYGSPDCGRLAPLPHVLENLYAGKIRLVVRQYPFAPPESALAAQASLAAHAQGKFWEYRDTLFANPHDHGREALERYAREIGLDVDAFARALDRGEYRADVTADRELGQRLGLRDVPAVFANGVRVSTPYGVNDLAKLAAAVGEH